MANNFNEALRAIEIVNNNIENFEKCLSDIIGTPVALYTRICKLANNWYCVSGVTSSEEITNVLTSTPLLRKMFAKGELELDMELIVPDGNNEDAYVSALVDVQYEHPGGGSNDLYIASIIIKNDGTITIC